MYPNKYSRKPLIAALIVSVLVLLLALSTQFAQANIDGVHDSQEASTDSTTGTGDDATFEVGVEWINDFPGTINDRTHWDESCDGLYDSLLSDGWISSFRLVDGTAWETDFKNESLHGHEDAWVDTADIAMVCTHGSNAYDSFWGQSLSSVYFASAHDDIHLSPGDAYQAYGDKDLEWLAIDSCSVLKDSSLRQWGNTFNGLHLLLGFKNTMYVNAPGDGDYWAYYLKGIKFLGFWILPPHTVMQSWFTAVDYNQPSETCARVMGEEMNSFNDHLWGKGYVSQDYAIDNDLWYWDHCSTGASQLLSNARQPEILAVPIYTIDDRLVDVNYVRNKVAPAFDFTGPIAEGGLFYFMLDTSGGITRTLQVDKISGSFLYHDLSRLWIPAETPPALPSESLALAILGDWYKNDGATLPGSQYIFSGHTFEVEELIGMQRSMSENNIPQEIARTPMNVVMTYPHIVQVNAVTTEGEKQLDFEIFGPGGRMKAYLGDGGDIIGMQGGSRDIVYSGQNVDILNPDLVWEMFIQNPSLAIPEVPWVGDVITYTGASLGYYEQPYLLNQEALIPVWNFTANYYSKGTLLAEDVTVYVPAANEFIPPDVAILNPAAGSTFRTGEVIEFEGSVSGGTAPYRYEWTSSSNGYLGNTLNIVASLESLSKSSSIFNSSVSLQVTDANGLINTATISLQINPAFWLPYLVK